MTAVICDACRMAIDLCPCCGSLVCDNCIVECDRCGNQVCRGCVNKYGVCLVCLQEEEEENYD